MFGSALTKRFRATVDGRLGELAGKSCPDLPRRADLPDPVPRRRSDIGRFADHDFCSHLVLRPPTRGSPHRGQYNPRRRSNGPSRIARTSHDRAAPIAAATAIAVRVTRGRPGTANTTRLRKPKTIIAPIVFEWNRCTIATLAAKSAPRKGTGPTDPEGGRGRGTGCEAPRTLRRVRKAHVMMTTLSASANQNCSRKLRKGIMHKLRCSTQTHQYV